MRLPTLGSDASRTRRGSCLDTFVILGCGFTGRRVAEHFVSYGAPVIATTRHPAHAAVPGLEVVPFTASATPDLSFVPTGSRVLYSIPTAEVDDPTPQVIAALAARKPARLVYLSTTGVYGPARVVDERTPVADSSHPRVFAERAVLEAGCSALVLRPAAIYGPGRGAHIKVRSGRFLLAGDGSNYTSRIHVDDLAAISAAALLHDVTGAWPVADEEPCTSREIAEFCATLLGAPMPAGVDASELHPTRRANRRVDGRAILGILRVQLRYPSYRTGIPASVNAE